MLGALVLRYIEVYEEAPDFATLERCQSLPSWGLRELLGEIPLPTKRRAIARTVMLGAMVLKHMEQYQEAPDLELLEKWQELPLPHLKKLWRTPGEWIPITAVA